MSEPATLSPGTRVRVRRAAARRHVRTPAYCQGLAGEIVAFHGRYPNPEDLAYHGDGHPKLALYQVRLSLREIGQSCEAPPSDTLLVDLYEHWLEAPELAP